MPQFSDVMVYKNDANAAETKEFDIQIQVFDIPNAIQGGYLASGHCGFCPDPHLESGAA